jgi:nucleoside diphosphate kinase
MLLESEPLCFRIIKADREFLRKYHYSVHSGKFFFDWLLDYVTASEIAVIILQGSNIIDKVRERLGPTVPEKATKTSPSSLRAQYGLFGGVNIAHASDSRGTAKNETDLWASHLSLTDNNNAKREIQEFIEQRIDLPCIDALRYRELFKQLVSDTSRTVEIQAKFSALLRKESSKDNNTIERLSKVLVWRGLIEEAITR